MIQLRKILLSSLMILTMSSCAQSRFTALEQQQISIEDPKLFEKSNAFTIDFAAVRDKGYSFPLPVGKAKVVDDYQIEIETKKGDAVKAMFDGTVRLSKHILAYGNVIVIRHDNGLETVYSNNAENLVKSGDRVKAGSTIAIVGTHNGRTFCRFSIMVNGGRINPETIIGLESHRLRKQTILCQKTASWKVDVSVLQGPRIDEAKAEQWWCFPLPGAKVISPYGRRGGRQHTGVDLKTKPNDNIYAAFDGEVVFSARYSGYGFLIRIRHDNGLETYYSHNSKNMVKVGDRVKAGDLIALTGQTGRATTAHLHFETRINGRAYNPARFFDYNTQSIRLNQFKKTKDGYKVK